MLEDCVLDLERHGEVVRVREEVDPYLEMAEIQRRASKQNAPALLFERVKGSPFPAISNLYGSQKRCELMFRNTLDRVKHAVKFKANPKKYFHPSLAWAGLTSLPKKVSPGKCKVLKNQTRVELLPAIQSWPKDGGPFITLGQVYTEDLDQPGVMHSNLGMYRIQMSGNDYVLNEEMGMHYQIHRGIGIHHAKAIERGQELKVSIFIGGHPAHAFSAVMPLPEVLPELLFASMLSGKRFRYAYENGYMISADADFCITGTIAMNVTKPEGPFGDHLGYYSLAHDFPVLKINKIYHKPNAIWPFTVVGRPPQEDTQFGKMIHDITGPMVPKSLPGVKALHAVDEAGVHPLLLAIGSERYVPYQDRKPQEILTQANAILGFNQCSLAKFLFIVAGEDNTQLDLSDIKAVLRHVLTRVDWTRDLHFQTKTTMDTLDYSGEGINEGSKLVIAACGDKKRKLAKSIPEALELPKGFGDAKMAMLGIMVISGPKFERASVAEKQMQGLCQRLEKQSIQSHPLIVVVDDSDFTTSDFSNFLWVTFTRSNPSHDCYGVNSFVEYKHWGCKESLILDARMKPHHAPVLEVDGIVQQRVNELCGPGKSLHRILS